MTKHSSGLLTQALAARTNLINWATKNFIFLILALIYFLYLIFFSITRHISFHSLGLDMAVFEQVYWNSVNGRFWEFSLELVKATPHSYFANHFSPFLLLLVPIYYLFPYAQTLLTLQSLALVVGVVPIYLFALEILKSSKKALFVVLIYFLSPFIQNINLFDFHEVSFFIPIFGFCLLFLFRKKWLLFWIFLILSLSIKEEIGLIGFGLGIFLILKKEYKTGILVSLFSLVWTALAVKGVIPYFAKGDYKFASYRYTDFGLTTNEIVTNILQNPFKVIAVLLKPQKIYFLSLVLASTGFVSLLGGFLLTVLAVPVLYLLLASYQPHYSYTAQYSAVLIPILFFAFVIGLKKLEGFKYKKFIYSTVFIAVLVESILFGQLPFSRRFDTKNFQTDSHYSRFEEIKRKIPKNVSLSAQDFVISHLSQQRYLEFYSPETNADYVFLDIAAVHYNSKQYNVLIAHHLARNYKIVDCSGGLCLLKSQKVYR